MKHGKRSVLIIALCAAVLFSACPGPDSGTGNENAITAVSVVGGATSLGWGPAGGAPLSIPMESKGNNVFEKTLSLSAGQLIFSCDKKPSWGGRWFLPPDDRTSLEPVVTVTNDVPMNMVLSNNGNGGESGPKWQIPKSAEYTISVNTQTRKVTFTEIGDYQGGGTDDVFNYMWLIDCKEIAPLATAMTKVGDNWTITTPLVNNDYVKFSGEDTAPTVWGTAEAPDTSQKWFCPPSDGMPALDTTYANYGADNSFAWKIVASGTYTITLDPTAGTVTFQSDSVSQSDNLWLVRTTEILSASNSFAMTENPAGSGTYTWEGALQGWYKFCAADTAPLSYNTGIWYGPNVDSQPPSGVSETASMGSAFAWQIPYGKYVITFKPADQEVTIVLDPNGPGSGDFNELWVIGIESMLYEGANFWDAPNNTARKMTKSGDTFTWAYNFNENYRHIRILCRDNGIIFYPNPAQLTPSRGDVQMAANQEYDIFTYDEAKAFLEAAGSTADVGMLSWQALSGTNTITVNLSTKKIKCAAGGTPVDPGQGENAGGGGEEEEEIVIDTTTVSNILLYGDGCATGWNTNPNTAGAVKLFTQSANVYAWKGPLTGGQLKFHNGTADIGAGAYTAVPGIGGTFPAVAGNGGTWAISAAGTYVVRLDLNTNQVSFIVQ